MIELYKIPSDKWQTEFEKVMQDPYIQKKYSRIRRLAEKQIYVTDTIPEVMNGNGNVLDIGCGPGEFLEVCREYGNKIIGIDAPLDDCEMGNEYIRLSYLMTTRQKVPVKYIGFENILKKGKLPFKDDSFTIINSQGAIEQVFKDHLEGEPHKIHKDCNRLSWRVDNDLRDLFYHMYKEFERILLPGGLCVIYGNGAKNTSEYNALVNEIIERIDGLTIIEQREDRFHKIRK